jgi:hypothetical protein
MNDCMPWKRCKTPTLGKTPNWASSCIGFGAVSLSTIKSEGAHGHSIPTDHDMLYISHISCRVVLPLAKEADAIKSLTYLCKGS